MRILLLSFYYPPDLSAGSFRASALVQALREVGPEDLEIDVLTTMPNRYHSMENRAAGFEQGERLTIQRFPIPPHRSGMVDQARSFASYAFAVTKNIRGGTWDAVVATSSRLMTAALGARMARKRRIPLYLDNRDLFADTMSDLLVESPLRAVLPGLRWLERRTFRTATRVNVVSAGFLPYLRELAPDHEYRVFTNGIDEEFLVTDFSSGAGRGDGTPVCLYAGNMGEGQGLHEIIPELAARLSDRVRFRLIGDGGRRQLLEDKLRRAGVSNVEIMDPVPRAKLLDQYRDADYLFLHLNNHPAFRKVLPSKIFEYAATGKPILAGVAGHASDFLAAEVPGAYVFPPCDAGGGEEAFARLQSQSAPPDREEFNRKYARRQIMEEMARDILDMVEQGAHGR